MNGLPPQLDSDPDGLEGIVVRFPREAPLTDWRKHAAWSALGVIPAEVGLLFWVRTSPGLGTLVLAGIAQLGVLALYRWLTRPTRVDLTHFEVHLDVSGLTVDGERFPWTSVRSLYWNCEPPTTDLHLELVDGRSRTFVCDRRNRGDAIGVTRRQREWLERRAEKLIERAGSAGAVPAHLRDIEARS